MNLLLLLMHARAGEIACQEIVHYPSNNENCVNSGEFSECKELISITFDDSIKEIGSLAFYFCTNLQNITFPTSLKTIKTRAFQGCSSLKIVTLPEGFEMIESYAFHDTTSLEHIYLPSTLIDFGAFAILGSGANLVLHLTEPCNSFTCFNGMFLLRKDKTRITAATASVTVESLYFTPGNNDY